MNGDPTLTEATGTFIIRLDEANDMVESCALENRLYSNQVEEVLKNLRAATDDLLAVVIAVPF
jgi:hypothetical protein